MRGLSLTILFAISIVSLKAQMPIDKVIGVVGKYPVLLSDIETNYVQKKKEEPNITKCRSLEDVVFQKMLLAQADRDSVTVSDNEVEGELNRRMTYYINALGGEEKFEAFYGVRTNVFKDQMRDEVHNQLLAQKMQQKIMGEIKLTPSEVRTFYSEIPVDSLPLINSELEIEVIARKPVVSEAAKKDARAVLETYRQRVLKGESMSVLAALYSEDPGSAKNGGRYESVMRGMMVPEFESVAFRLKKPGEISEVFESSFGFHFIELIARKGESVDIRHILITAKTTQTDVYRQRIFLDSLKKAIEDKTITFEDAARRFSSDNATKNAGGMMVNPATTITRWENEDINQLDQRLLLLFDKMNPGDITIPMDYIDNDSKPGYRMFLLKARIDPHKANMKEDYSKLLMMATFEKQKKQITDWITKKSKITYIKLDPEYMCEFEHNWTFTK